MQLLIYVFIYFLNVPQVIQFSQRKHIIVIHLITFSTLAFYCNSFVASPRTICYYITWSPVESLSCPIRLRPWLSTYQCHNYSCKAESRKLQPESSKVIMHLFWVIYHGEDTCTYTYVFLYFYRLCAFVSSAMLFIDQAAIYWVTYMTWVCPTTASLNPRIFKPMIRGGLLA